MPSLSPENPSQLVNAYVRYCLVMKGIFPSVKPYNCPDADWELAKKIYEAVISLPVRGDLVPGFVPSRNHIRWYSNFMMAVAGDFFRDGITIDLVLQYFGWVSNMTFAAATSGPGVWPSISHISNGLEHVMVAHIRPFVQKEGGWGKLLQKERRIGAHTFVTVGGFLAVGLTILMAVLNKRHYTPILDCNH